MESTFTPGVYSPPGVYTVEVPAVLPQTQVFAGDVVGIIGPGIGYRVGWESVTLNGTDPSQLSKTGIDLGTISVLDVNGLPVDAGDYTVVQAGDNTTIARSGTSGLADGVTLSVNYEYTDDDYSTPYVTRDQVAVAKAFGDALDPTTGAVVSPVTLASQIAFANGASVVEIVAIPGTPTSVSVSDLQAGLGLLLSHPEVTIVVPLSLGIAGTDQATADAGTLAQNLKDHAETAAAAGMYRIGIVGYGSSYSGDPTKIASAVHDRRVMVAWPNAMSYSSPSTNGSTNSITLPGAYLAAAYAGRMASLPPNTPLTRKAVVGFDGIDPTASQAMTTPLKNTWGQGGVAVTEANRQGALWVRHGVSTDPTSTLTREPSLVRSQDAVIGLIDSTLESAAIIGSPMTADMAARVQGLVQGCLETAKTATYIIGYKDVSVVQQGVDPSILSVTFAYQPTWPLNYIVVSFSLDTTTGLLATNTQQVATGT